MDPAPPARAAPLSCARLELWKETAQRVVALVRDESGAIFVRKIHKGPRGAARARREARALRLLATASVPAPRVLDLHVEADESWLDLEHLAAHRSLEALLPALATERASARTALELLPSALALVDASLEAGLLEPDLHAGNVLVGPGGELALIDLHRSRPLPPALTRLWRRRARRRFLRAFLPFAPPAALARRLPLPQGDAAALVRAALASRRALLRGKDRRADGAHRSFARLDEAGGRWLCERDLDPAVRALALACARGPRAPERVLKERAEARVLALDERWVAKLYRGAPRAAQRRARAAWRASLAVAHSRVRATRARGLWCGPDGALLLLERGPARDLSRWLHGERPARRAQLRVARELGRAIAVLHRDGLRPRDLRAENFLLDEALHATLVDLDGIAPRRRRVPALARCARDVARLRASFPPEAPLDAGAVELFARTYAAERGLSAEHLRRWRAIAAARAEELWELWRKRGLRFDAAGIHERA